MSASTSRYTLISAWSLARTLVSSRVCVQSPVTLISPILVLRPDRPGIASVFGDDHLAKSVCARGHAARESVQRGPLAEHADKLVRVHGGDLPHVEVPQPLLQLERAAERLLHLDLLIKHQPDQQREWIGLQETVCFRVVSPSDGHLKTLPFSVIANVPALPHRGQRTYHPGSREDFDRLYRRAYPRVYRTLAAILGDPDDAEDCAQDAFVKAFHAWKH